MAPGCCADAGSAPPRPDGDDTQPRRHRQQLLLTAKGDQEAYAALFDQVAPKVVGVCRRVVRDPARSEEVAQEVPTEVWRIATRFDPDRGSAMTWIMTIAHRRAVDCVRSVQASRDRDERLGHRDRDRAFDQVVEAVETREEHQRVRAALASLTDLQREVVDGSEQPTTEPIAVLPLSA